MCLSDLTSPLLLLIFEFTQPVHIQKLRGLSLEFQSLLDDAQNPRWKSILDKHSTPKVQGRILFARSLGTTALMVRGSVVRQTCVSCRLWFNLERNRFHDLIVCRRCSKRTIFKVVNLKKACFNYFLDYGTQKENGLLVKERKGRSFSVLLKDIRRVAFARYPDGELEKKMDARFARAYKTELRKQSERGKRIQDTAFKFTDVLWQNPARVDDILRDQAALEGLVRSYGLLEDVYGDVLDYRVKASTKTSVVAQHLYDYAAMLTYMRKLCLLDFRYGVTPGHRCHPSHVYRQHVHGGLHFYELSKQHADSFIQLSSRTSYVGHHLVMLRGDEATWTTSKRKTLAVAMCAEEGINYKPDDFEGFVLEGQGNPVAIARHVREREFLLQNHLVWETNSFLVAGHDHDTAESLGVKNVLHRTKGFPPMMRSCIINLSIAADSPATP